MLSLDVIMYIVLLLLLLLVFLVEKRDWRCINSYDLWSECQVGEAMPYRGSTPKPEDTCSELLDKINIASDAENNSIKWRRAFILAAVICIVIFGLVVSPGRIPVYTDLYISVIIATFILYFNFNYYSYHHFREPSKKIHASTKILSERISRGMC